MNAQEQFWAGEFGDAYTERNRGRTVANNHFFLPILARTMPASVVELGCGAGENLAAIKWIKPDVHMQGVEINASAAESARLVADKIWEGSVEDWLGMQGDLAFTKGLLIHIAPDRLERVYEVLRMSTKRYMLVAEYYSKTPREIEYRGHAGKLWTRDFGGELLDKFPDMKLIECVFHYDRLTGQDNITHWLMERK